MYRIRNGQNVYRTVKERIYRSHRIKRISSHTCIGHEVHSRYCVSFSKVFIIMHEYVNKIICKLSYDKTYRTLYRLSFGTKFLSLGYLAAYILVIVS